jgi:hypothetical protein
VYAEDVCGIGPTHLRGDERTLVTALNAVPFVPEPPHQFAERPGDAGAIPSRLAQRLGEAVTGKRWNHQMERVGGAAAMFAGRAQGSDDVKELDDRSGPAVDEHQGRGVRLGGTHMQEMDVLAVDRDGELRVLVEPRLLLTPIKRRAPVLGQFLEIGERHAAGPPDSRQLIRPARAREAIAQVDELGFGHIDEEGLDRRVSHVVHLRLV